MTDIYIYIYHNIQCQTSQLKTWTNNLNSILPKKWLKSTWKGAQQHQSLGKHKTMRYYNIPTWMTSNKKKTVTNVSRRFRKYNSHILLVGMKNDTATLKTSFSFLKG